MKKILWLLLALLFLCSCGAEPAEIPTVSEHPPFTVEQKDGKVMPSFTYSGDNPALVAICDWFYEEAQRHGSYGDVWIPSFIIYKEVERDGEHLVFGNFWSAGYRLEGDTMVQGGGGEMPAVFHLVLTDKGYAVASVETARDGAYFTEDIKAFTKGYVGLYTKYMNDHDNDEEEIAFMRMYAEDNDLDIRFIKHYGWDPVPLY